MRLHTWNNKNLLPVQWVFYQVAFYDGYQYLLVIIIIIIKMAQNLLEILKDVVWGYLLHFMRNTWFVFYARKVFANWACQKTMAAIMQV